MSPETNLPRRLGRYEVVRALSSGEASSVLLGRREGDESGRPALPVTIRRLAPSLARGPAALTFAARVRRLEAVEHANIPKLHEVSQEDGELFVVTEHPQGESAASLLERLHSEGRTLSYSQAAHIVAEAAAALHAAHEQGVLHERLTPDDVVIGYDGRIKVLDAGITSALDALTGTPTIHERELPYASPERCEDDPLDRRTDVFSLGAILWELMTGLSPFERETHAETLRAILNEDLIVPPPNILRTLPLSLSEIAMCAVSRERSKRYATAQAFRHELLACLHGLTDGEPSAEVADLMQASFAERIRESAELFREAEPPAEADNPFTKPTVEFSLPAVALPTSSPSRPDAELLSPGDPAASLVGESTTYEPPPIRRNVRFSRKAVLLAALGAMLVLGLVALLLRPSTPPPIARTSAAPLASSLGPLPLETSPAPAAPANNPIVGSANDVVGEETTLSIDTLPSNATILISGSVMGVTPLELKLPKSREPVVVEIRHAGYRTSKERVVPDVNQRLRVTLPLNAAPRATPSGAHGPYYRFE